MLRPYQVRTLSLLQARWAAGVRRVLVVAPTGAGKTQIAVEAARDAVASNGTVLIIAPWRTVISQTIARAREAGLPAGRWSSRSKPPMVAVTSFEALSRHQSERHDFSLVIVDEAHRAMSAPRRKLLQLLPCRQLLLTATPYRRETGGLRAIADDIVVGTTYAELTATGALVPARYWSGDEADYRRVPIVRGDFDAKALSRIMRKPRVVGDTVTEWHRISNGAPTLAFAASRADSRALVDAFIQSGVAAEHVDGTMPSKDRNEIIARFRAGGIPVLSNCAMLGEGFDAPTCGVIIARPTTSRIIWQQQVGRGLRPAPGKSECRVIDRGGNCYRHGLATDDLTVTLDGVARPEAGEICRRCGEAITRHPHHCVARPMLPPDVLPDRKPIRVEGRMDEVSMDDQARDRALHRIGTSTGYGALWVAREQARISGRAPEAYRHRVETDLRQRAKAMGATEAWIQAQLRELYG